MAPLACLTKVFSVLVAPNAQRTPPYWELRNIYHHHPESKKRKSSEANSGSIHPYGRYENAVKTRKTISTIAILWPVKVIFEKRAATPSVEVDGFLSPAVLKTLRDSELLRRSVFYYAPQVYYAVNLSLRGQNACKTPGKWCPHRGGRHSRSLCGSKFTTHGKFTTASALRPSRVKFAVFHTVFDVKFWWNFPSHTQTLENVARKISPKFHTKFHDTFGREKRRKISLPHFCRVVALINLLRHSDF